MELISKMFPGWALKRKLKFYQLEQVERAYEGAIHNDFYPVIPPGPPNLDLQNAGPILRDKARHLDQNYDLVIGILDTLVTNIVGNSDPIRPLIRRPDGELHTDANTIISRYWRQWSERPTICGRYTMLQMLKLACRAWLRDGEYLTRFVLGDRQEHPGSFPLSVELIEADRLPFDKTGDSPLVVQGIEIDKFNRPLAYHLFKYLPEDFFEQIGAETIRVDAREMLHLKFTRRTHQVRGVSILHGVMNRLDDLKDYEESERIAARVAAAMTGFIEKSGESMGKLDAGGKRIFEMSPGMIFDNLLPGETIGTMASNRPNPELINFRGAMLRAIAAGTVTNYSTISKDYNGTYSAQRQELLESKPGYKSLRHDFFGQYVRPIWREFIGMLRDTRLFSLQGIDPLTIDDIRVPDIDIGWIDPKKQADATEISIRNGITTRSQVIRDQGGDPAAVFSELIEENETLSKILTVENREQKNNEAKENGIKDQE